MLRWAQGAIKRLGIFLYFKIGSRVGFHSIFFLFLDIYVVIWITPPLDDSVTQVFDETGQLMNET